MGILIIAATAGCNVVLGFGSPTQAADDLRVAITKTTGSPTDPYFGFDVAVANDGPDDATQVTVDVGLPGESVFSTQAVSDCSAYGSQAHCVVPYVGAQVAAQHLIFAAIPGDGMIVATVSHPADTDLTNNKATLAMAASADLDLKPFMDGGWTQLVGLGAVQRYTFRLQNHGPSFATSVHVQFTTSAGFVPISATGISWSCSTPLSCDYPDLGPTAEAYSLKLALIVPRQMQTALTQVTAKVSATSVDPISVNDTVTIEQSLTDHADLGIAVTATPDPVAIGGMLKYSVVPGNFGPSEASNVTVTDTLPAGVSFVNAMGAGWTCAASGQDVTCTRPTLTVASAPAIDIVVTAPTAAGTITNTAVVSSANPDTNASNDTVSVTSTVGP